MLIKDLKLIIKMSFPLYDRLSKNITNKDLTNKQKQFFFDNIGNIDSNGKELLYVLIKYDSIENNINPNIIPYEGTGVVNEGLTSLTWSLNKLPNRLKHLLLNFLKIHVKNINEEKQRTSKIL